MKLLIEKSDLELLLEKKRDLIGNKVTIDTIIAGISFLLSVFTASYSDIFGISGTVLKTVFCLIGIGYTVNKLDNSGEWATDQYDMFATFYTCAASSVFLKVLNANDVLRWQCIADPTRQVTQFELHIFYVTDQ